MAQQLQVTPTRISVPASSTEQKLVTAFGDTVYYGSSSVTSSSYTGTLTDGQQLKIADVTWFVTANDVGRKVPGGARLAVIEHDVSASGPTTVVPHVPTDADFSYTPPDGVQALNSATGVEYVRIGGVWTALAATTVIESTNAVSVGAAFSITDPSSATINFLALTVSNCTLTFPASSPGKSFSLSLKQDATGGRTVTWPANIEWPDGTVPTLSAAPLTRDFFSFTATEDGNWIGFIRSSYSVHRGAYWKEVLTDRPLSYWRLGEAAGTSAIDERGAHNGTYVGSPTLAVAGAVPGNTAVTFVVTTSYVTAANAFLLGGRSAWTIEMWANGNQGHNGADTIIYNEAGGSGNDLIRVSLGTAAIFLDYHDDSTSNSVNSTSATPQSGEWHHIVVTKSGTAVAYYFDGQPVGTSTLTAADTFTNSSTQTTIAGELGGRGWSGSLDEVALYPNALSAARILAHYNASALA